MTASIWNPGTLETISTGRGTVTETSLMAGGQTIVSIATFTYTIGVKALFVYLNGVLQVLGTDYTETSTSSITFTAPNVVNDVVTFVGVVELVNIVTETGTAIEQDVASATTVNIGAIATNFIRITGTSAINSFGIIYRGPIFLRFAASLTLTHSASLLLPGTVNLVTVAGDTCILTPKATAGVADGWVVTNYQSTISSGGGGTSSGTYVAPTLGGTAVADFVLSAAGPIANSSTSSYYIVPSTAPNGWNIGAGKCTLDFEVQTVDYFLNNPNGHFAVVTRCDTSVIASAVRGTGAAFGDFTGVAMTNGTTVAYEPSAIAESFVNGVGPGGLGNWLLGNSESAPSKPLLDNTRYRIIIESTQTDTLSRYIRYRVYRKITAQYMWQLEQDTGDLLDPNVSYADLTKHGLDFGQVFASNISSWSIGFYNITCTWGPAYGATTDVSTKFSRYGGDLEGNINFLGNSRKILVNNVGTDFALWSTFQSKTPNSASTVLVSPNGTSVNANFIATNSNSASSYQLVGLGMVGGDARLNTYQIGATDAPIQVMIQGVTVATFTGTGITMNGATKIIGPASLSLVGMTNTGGTNATAFSNSAFDFEFAATDGNLRTFMSATPTNSQVEIVTRPLYCYMSALLKELRSRKLI